MRRDKAEINGSPVSPDVWYEDDIKDFTDVWYIPDDRKHIGIFEKNKVLLLVLMTMIGR